MGDDHYNECPSGIVQHGLTYTTGYCILHLVHYQINICLNCKRQTPLLIVTNYARYYGVWDLPNFIALESTYQVHIVMKPTNSPIRAITQPKKNYVTRGIRATFPHFSQQIVFRGLGLFLYRKQTARNRTQPNPPQTPYYKKVISWLCKIVRLTWYASPRGDTLCF